jgi:hypothetical protein
LIEIKYEKKTFFYLAVGAATPKESLLFVVIGSIGPYFPTGFELVSVLADTFYCRAVSGGMSAYKTGSQVISSNVVFIEMYVTS